jgi:hypothetical protein
MQSPPSCEPLAGPDAQRRISYALILSFPLLLSLHVALGMLNETTWFLWPAWPFVLYLTKLGLCQLFGSNRALICLRWTAPHDQSLTPERTIKFGPDDQQRADIA